MELDSFLKRVVLRDRRAALLQLRSLVSPMHLLPTWRNKIVGLGALGKSCGKFQTMFLPPFGKSINSTLDYSIVIGYIRLANNYATGSFLNFFYDVLA